MICHYTKIKNSGFGASFGRPVITPVGLSYAQTVDTSKEAKMKHEQVKAAIKKERKQRLEKQRQMAAETKAKMEAKHRQQKK